MADDMTAEVATLKADVRAIREDMAEVKNQLLRINGEIVQAANYRVGHEAMHMSQRWVANSIRNWVLAAMAILSVVVAGVNIAIAILT